MTTDGGRCLRITVDPKVHVALRGRNSGMLILGFVDTGNSDDWWWRAPMVPESRVGILKLKYM